MLLTLRATPSGDPPPFAATDLGFLVHKNPARAQSFRLTFGEAHVVWPEATPEAATLALLVDVDPIHLVRGKTHSPQDGPMAMYVNDRPYVASSFLSVALLKVFRSAINGGDTERPELARTPLPLQIEVHVVAARGGAHLLRRLFEPLGYAVTAERLARDATRPEWGDSALYVLRLEAEVTVQLALQHLYVLLPVLDDDKHYWVGREEVDKLMDKGAAWVGDHPERELIADRYLKHRRSLVRAALALWDDGDDGGDEGTDGVASGVLEEGLERPIKLNDVRLDRVVEILVQEGAPRVVDLGCGEGKLLQRLLRDARFTQLVGVDVSARALEVAERRVLGASASTQTRERVQLLHGSATYRDPRLEGFDAITLVEVIEHIDEERLPALVASVFGAARPRVVVITTPNAEYNARFESLPAGRFRHADHRFEWSREAFAAWAHGVAEAHGYAVRFEGVGPEDLELGAPTQVGVFRWR